MVKKNRKEKIRDLAKSYEPTPHERAALEAYRIQEEESPLAPRLRVTENDGATKICPDHPEPSVGSVLLMEALGTRDWDFLEGFLTQLAGAGAKGRKVDGQTLNFLLSVVKGIAPKDQVEAHARGPNGRRAHSDDDVRVATNACENYSAAR